MPSKSSDTPMNVAPDASQSTVLTSEQSAALAILAPDPIMTAIESLYGLLTSAATADGADSADVVKLRTVRQTMLDSDPVMFADNIASIEKQIDAARAASSRLVRDQMHAVYGEKIAACFAYLAPDVVSTKPASKRGRPANGANSGAAGTLTENRAPGGPIVAADAAEYVKRQPTRETIEETIENATFPVKSCGTCNVCVDALPTIGQQATANIRQALTRAVMKSTSAEFDASVPCILAFNRAFLASNDNVVSGQLYTRVTNAAAPASESAPAA